MASGLLDKANIILTPTGYKAGTMYNVAPIEQPYEDFDFARASVASRVNSSGLVEMVGRTLGSNLVQNGDFSELGPELVTNGDFATDSDWTLSSESNIINGELVIDALDGSFQYAQQDFNTIVGETYKVQFNITEINDVGKIQLLYGTLLIGLSEYTSVGTHTLYFTSVSSSDTFTIKRKFPSSTKVTIDNVSVKQVDPNDYWTLGNGATITSGAANFPLSISKISQSISAPTQNKIYRVELNSNRINTLNTAVIIYGNGFYGISDIPNVGQNILYITTNLSGGSQINTLQIAAGINGIIDNVVVQEVIDTNNIPRINYDSNGENGHWLLEPTSTNLLPYSEDFSGWTKLNGGTGSLPVVTSNTSISPSGEQNADTISFNKGSASGGGDYSLLRLDYGGADVDGTASIYLKADANVDIEISSDDINYQTVSVTNNWQRFTVSDATSDRLSMGLRGTVPSNNTATVYAWGAQLEELPYATSYIPTLTGSTVTRATETATGAGSADLINSTEGVLYAEIAALANDLTRRIITITDGTLNNIVKLEYKNTSNQIEAVVYNGNTECLILHTLSDETEFNKIAFKYKQDDFSLFVNGIKVGTDTSGAVFTPNTLNNLSFYQGNANNLFGKLKELAVFGEALSDDELEKLTSWSSFNAMATDLGYTIE